MGALARVDRPLTAHASKPRRVRAHVRRTAGLLAVRAFEHRDQPHEPEAHREQNDNHDEEAEHRERTAPLRVRPDPQGEERPARPEVQRGEADQR